MVGMDRSTIFRRAMACLGDAEYVTGAPSERVLEVHYGAVLQEACARYNWSFTRRRAVVRGEGEAVGGMRVFKLPLDCMKVVEVRGMEGRRVLEPEMGAEGLLLPVDEAGEVVVVYHADLLGDVGVLGEGRCALFCEGVVRLLAGKAAMALTSNMELGLMLLQSADGYFCRAILADKQQDWSNAKEPRALRRRSYL